MGTGNKQDPTALKVTDISKTNTCPLARVMRRELNKRGCNLTVVPAHTKAEEVLALNPDGIMLALCGIESMQTAEARAAVEKVYAANLRDGLTGAQDINVYLAYNWKANANGVDLNRNFALSNWADVKTGILSPCFRNYKCADFRFAGIHVLRM